MCVKVLNIVNHKYCKVPSWWCKLEEKIFYL